MSAFNTLRQALYSCGLKSGRKYVPCILKYVRHILNYVRPNFFLLQAGVKTYVHKLTFRTPQKYALPPCNSGCKQILPACRHTFAVRNNAISHKPSTLQLKSLFVITALQKTGIRAKNSFLLLKNEQNTRKSLQTTYFLLHLSLKCWYKWIYLFLHPFTCGIPQPSLPRPFGVEAIYCGSM